MTDDRWRSTYDAWKLASPEDELPPLDCDVCGGQGWVVAPACCGKPRIVWGANPRTGEPEPVYEECCGAPDPVQETCDNCRGSGKQS